MRVVYDPQSESRVQNGSQCLALVDVIRVARQATWRWATPRFWVSRLTYKGSQLYRSYSRLWQMLA